MGRKTGKNRQFWEAARNNNFTFAQYYQRFVELATSMFRWDDMPDTVNLRYLELVLFAEGRAVFFYEPDIGYIALPCADYGELNIYGEPIEVMAYSHTGSFTKVVHIGYPGDDDKNGVIIWNNVIHTNSALDCEMYSRRLWNIDRAIDVNVNAQKTPILIRTEKQQELTMRNLYQKYDGNEPVIYGDAALNPNALTVLKTEAKFVADDLQGLKTQLFNEYLTRLGISNMNFIKKERLISDEVLRSQGSTMASRYSRLAPRQTAANEINTLFPDLNVSCMYREDVSLALERVEEALGEETHGGVYNGSKNNL